MKKIFLILLLGLFLISFVSAIDDPSIEAEIQTFKQCQSSTLLLQCKSDLGGYCNPTMMCNVSIFYSNGSTLVSNASMSNTGAGIYSYQLSSSQTCIMGDYPYSVSCRDSLSSGTGTSKYIVDPKGFVQTTSQGINSLVFLFLMFGLTCLFGWIGFKLSESKNLWILGLFFLFLSLLFVVYDVWLGYDYHRSFTGLSDSNMPQIMFFIFIFLLSAGLLVSLILLFTRWKDLAKYYRNEIKRKEEEDIDLDFDE